MEEDTTKRTQTVTVTVTDDDTPRTLKFTFSDDGSTVTIAASGSLDVSGFNYRSDTTSLAFREIPRNSDRQYGDMANVCRSWIAPHHLADYDSLPNFVTTGRSTYTGLIRQVETPSNYSHDFVIWFTT